MPRPRWKPTPHQLMILQDLYRKGLTNPNSSQVQMITAHLSMYGKIQWKNVFYWFQNHKARDRQNMRKKLLQQMQNYTNDDAQNPPSPPPPPPPPPPPSSNTAAVNYQLYPNSPTVFLHQVEATDASPHMVNYVREINCMRRANGGDWILMTNGGSSSIGHCSNNRPLRTLELFPVATTGFKD